MRQLAFVSLLLLFTLGCGSRARSEPRTSDSEVGSAEDSVGQFEGEKKTERKVLPAESDDDKPALRQMGRVAVSSDPEKHGDAIRFRFAVNGVPVSGVFQAPGGRNSTFSIPAGTVTFVVDECEWEEQGFPLAAGEEMALECKLTNEGDCCGVAIPVEPESAPEKK